MKSEMRHKLAEDSHLQGPEINGAEGSQGAETCILSISPALAPVVANGGGSRSSQGTTEGITGPQMSSSELLALGACRPGLPSQTAFTFFYFFSKVGEFVG